MYPDEQTPADRDSFGHAPETSHGDIVLETSLAIHGGDYTELFQEFPILVQRKLLEPIQTPENNTISIKTGFEARVKRHQE